MSNKNEFPSDFDWVTARAQCSPLNMYELLKAEAQKNVETMEAVAKSRGEQGGLALHVNDGSFAVIRRGHFREIGVRFTLRQETIEVESVGLRSNKPFSATLTLKDSGECRLLVNGDQLDRWQFLRRALEPLFFPVDR
jgi:hypothetical protein